MCIRDRFGGPSLNGALWSLLSLVAVLAVASLVLVPAGRRLGAAALADPLVWWVIAACLVLPMYHQPYDLLVALVPITLAVRRLDRLPSFGEVAVLVGAGSFLAVSFAGTWRGQAKVVRLLHVDAHSVTQTFHVLPTVTLVLTAATAMVVWRRAPA